MRFQKEFIKLKVSTTAAKFIAYAMPANFVADLETDLAAIGGKKSEQTGGPHRPAVFSDPRLVRLFP